MSKYDFVTKAFIVTNIFTHDGITIDVQPKEEKDYRFAPGTVLPMRPEDKKALLRMKIVEIVQCMYQGNYDKIEAKCYVNRDVLRKFIAGRTQEKQKKRNMTRIQLAKLAVGTPLSMEMAEQLFELQGYALDPKNNLFDAIVVNCIETNELIDVFFEMCKEHQFIVRVLLEMLRKHPHTAIITYGELCAKIYHKVGPRNIAGYLGDISKWSVEIGGPMLSAMGVNQSDYRPGNVFLSSIRSCTEKLFRKRRYLFVNMIRC